MGDISVESATVAEWLLTKLRDVLPQGQPIALHEPRFMGMEAAFVQECIESGWVSSVGKFVDRIETQLAELTGARHAIAVANGTAALQVALHLAGVRPDDEVLVPALSFVATANAVAHCSAIPHFADSSPRTLGMDPEALRSYLQLIAERTAFGWRNKSTGRRLAAVVPMHTFGHPVDLDGMLALAYDYDIPLIEDAAESLGSLYNGRHTGTFGLIGTLSFNGNKIVTTGGGGALLTNSTEVAKRAKHLTTTAKRPHRWEFFHDAVAWNYRMPNLNAALGCAQLDQLASFVSAKRELASRYMAAFAASEDFDFVVEPSGCRSNYWLNAISLKNPDLELRNRILDLINEAGIMCRPVWSLLSGLPMYSDCPRAPLHVAERLERSIINLPSSPFLASKEGR